MEVPEMISCKAKLLVIGLISCLRRVSTYSLTTNPGGFNVAAGGQDVDNLAEVGVRGEAVVLLRGTDRAGRGLGSRGRALGVNTLVTGSDGKEEAGIDNTSSSIVDGLGEATAKGHVDDDALRAVLLSSVLDGEVHTTDDTGGSARSVGVEDLDGEELSLLGDTVGLGADGAGNVGAVAITVSVVIVGEVLEPLGAALEFGVLGVNTGVDNVGAGALTGAVVVGVGGAAGLLAGKTGNAPGSVGLSGVLLDDGVLLNVLNVGVVAEVLELLRG